MPESLIAWATAEHIHNQIKARTLFATHYHELTTLGTTLERAENFHVAVKEWNDEIVFLRKLVAGGTNRSYGIQVGRLAGLPDAVIHRAKDILATLETTGLDKSGSSESPTLERPEGSGHPRATTHQLSLFEPAHRGPSPVEKVLEQMEPDTLTPIEALNHL